MPAKRIDFQNVYEYRFRGKNKTNTKPTDHCAILDNI